MVNPAVKFVNVYEVVVNDSFAGENKTREAVIVTMAGEIDPEQRSIRCVMFQNDSANVFHRRTPRSSHWWMSMR